MPPTTKAELQTELRELNRGYPRMPVSKMKVHELEAAIDAARKMKGDAHAALATKTPALPGPKGPREIPVQDVESGDVVIHAPQMPQPRFKKSQKVTISVQASPARGVAAGASGPDKEDSDDDHGPVSPAPVKRLAAPKKEVVPKKKAVKASSASHAEPSTPHTKSLPTHYCNCPSCPTKHK
jgi:hypothetical protein